MYVIHINGFKRGVPYLLLFSAIMVRNVST